MPVEAAMADDLDDLDALLDAPYKKVFARSLGDG